MTPPTLSRHLRVLRQGGLIADDEPAHDARVRLYRLQPRGAWRRCKTGWPSWKPSGASSCRPSRRTLKKAASLVKPQAVSGIPGDQARVTVGVAVPPEECLSRSSPKRCELWWRRGRRFRNAPGDGETQAGVIYLEPGPGGGRLFESFRHTPPVNRWWRLGRTLVWQPPQRLLLQWRASNFAPHEHTEVEVLFKPSGAAGTQVTVVHRGWAALRADHPVRHGLDAPAFVRMMGLWWGDLLTALRLHASGSMRP